MTGYRIELRPTARKALLGLDKPIRRRVQRAIDELAAQPRPHGAIPVIGYPGSLRIRVGDYRVVYAIRDHELLVLVIDVGHRSTVYRDT